MKVSRFTFKTRGNDVRLQSQKVTFKYDLRKYCFTIYIIFIESEEIRPDA